MIQFLSIVAYYIILELLQIGKKYPTETTLEISLQNRPYSSKKYFLGNDHRNGIGEWFGYFITFHAIVATISIILLPIPALITIKGSKYHKIFGLISIEFVTLICVTGMFIAKQIEYSRGDADLEECNYLRASFPVWNYIQFVYLLPWLMESISYGVATAIWQNMVRKYKSRYYLYFILLCIVSLFAMFTNGYHFWMYAKYWFCPQGVDKCIPCHTDSEQLLIYKLYGFAFSFELLTSVLSIKNLIFLFEIMRNKEFIDDKVWKDTHGRNMLTIAFIVYWTYLANIAYKTDIRLTPVTYIVAVVFAVVTYLYNKYKRDVWFFLGQIMVLTNFLPAFVHVVVLPYYVYKTFVVFDMEDLATFEDRPYLDSSVFRNNTDKAFRNEFGVWFTNIVLFHAFFGLLSCCLIPIPLFLTEKGKFT